MKSDWVSSLQAEIYSTSVSLSDEVSLERISEVVEALVTSEVGVEMSEVEFVSDKLAVEASTSELEFEEMLLDSFSEVACTPHEVRANAADKLKANSFLIFFIVISLIAPLYRKTCSFMKKIKI